MHIAHPYPKKSLGQHFLKNRPVCERIASLLESTTDTNILEIGPGAGALTAILNEVPHKNMALIEKDHYWADFHQKKVWKNAVVIEEDALTFDWTRLGRLGKWAIAGNLPYNIASPLIWDILAAATGWQKAVFMTQKEVGLRLAARPDSKAYGALTAWVCNFAIPKVEFNVSPGSFFPPPKVQSLVISFQPIKSPLPPRPYALKKLISLCFQNRRKQIGVILRASKMPALNEGLRELNLDQRLRPENLTPQNYLALSHYWPD